MKAHSGSWAALRNTADAAALITWDLSGCGRASLRTSRSGKSASVTRHACALGGFTFGHEIAHNFGCYHNPEQGGL